MTDGGELLPGTVVWVKLDPAAGREQGGRRPAVIVSGARYLAVVTSLVVVVPVTGVDRGWSNHVALGQGTGLGRPSWAMTEQPRTISRTRIHGIAGLVDGPTLDEIAQWLQDFLVAPGHRAGGAE